MLKIKVFRSNNYEELEAAVNDFLVGKKVKTIQYKNEYITTQYDGNIPIRGCFYDTIFVAYYDNSENKEV